MITKEQAQKSAIDFLKKHTVGVLATVGKENQPSASTVYYVVTDDFHVYFLTSHTTRKHLNIQQNNKVGFTVGFGPEYINVSIRGHAVEAEGKELADAFEMIAALQMNVPLAKWPIMSVEELKKGGLVLYKIIPEEAGFLNINSEEQPNSISNFIYHVVP